MSTLNYPVSSLDQQSLPAERRLVYLLTMKGRLSAEKQSALQRTFFSMGKDRGLNSDVFSKEEWRENHPQIKSRLWPIFLTDFFWLWQKIALVRRRVSALKQLPQKLVFTSHKNLSYDVALSLFFSPTVLIEHKCNEREAKAKMNPFEGEKNIIGYNFFSAMHKYFLSHAI